MTALIPHDPIPPPHPGWPWPQAPPPAPRGRAQKPMKVRRRSRQRGQGEGRQQSRAVARGGAARRAGSRHALNAHPDDLHGSAQRESESAKEGCT